MKLTVVAVIASFCLVVANATIASENEVDLEYNPKDLASEEVVDVETFGALYWTLKAALRSLKGINCSIKGVLNIKAGAEKFISDVNACRGVASQQVQSIITACKNVISTANAIITLNDASCNKGDSSDENNGPKKTPYFSCFVKMLGKMSKLYTQIRKVISLIQKVPDASVGAGVCVHNALQELESVFVQFPTWVKNCSKLTSN